jgi:hypothetical protein
MVLSSNPIDEICASSRAARLGVVVSEAHLIAALLYFCRLGRPTRHHACHVQRMRASSFAKSTIVTGKDGSARAADNGRDAIDGNQAITFNAVQFAS